MLVKLTGHFTMLKQVTWLMDLCPIHRTNHQMLHLLDDRMKYFIETLGRELKRTKENSGKHFCLTIIFSLLRYKPQSDADLKKRGT